MLTDLRTSVHLLRCECGKFHLHGARYCDRCGAQPPRVKGTGRNEPQVVVEESEVAAFIDACTAINAALEATRGVWGVA